VIRFYILMGSHDEGLVYPVLEPGRPRLQTFDSRMDGTAFAERHPMGRYGYVVLPTEVPG
jgi:hypothetical protein